MASNAAPRRSWREGMGGEQGAEMNAAANAPKLWNGPPGMPEEMTDEDFNEVVEVFRTLQRWRDESERRSTPDREDSKDA